MMLNVISEQKNDLSADERQILIFKALTHPARIAILDLLRDGEHCVCHLEAFLGFRQAYISQQLAVLREAGLIQDRRDGWNIFYRVIDPQIYAVLDTVRAMTGAGNLSANLAAVCSCPSCGTKVAAE